MSTNQEQQRKAGIPRLRVFRGEEVNKDDDHRPSDALRHARLKWARCEAYWAGRNHATRLSARLVA